MNKNDPYALTDHFDGGVFVKGAPGGRETARLVLSTSGIRAETASGVHELPWRGARLERANGDTVLVHSADRKTTVFCTDPDFLRGIESAGGNDLNDALSRLAGERVSSTRRHLLGCLAVLLVLAGVIWGVPLLFHASVDGVVSALPYSVDESIGEAVVGAMDPGGKEVDDEEVRAAIEAMLERLEPHLALEGVTLNFRIIENELTNAYALPGGYVTVFTGLMQEADYPEEVCGVLAHELAHVTERHGLRRVAHSVGLWAAISLLVGDVGGLTSIAVELFSLATVNDYSQGQETEADLEGVRMMVAARIDPSHLATFFKRLEEEYGDVPDALSWISTHPQHAERVAAIRAATPEDVEWEPLAIDWAAVKERLAE